MSYVINENIGKFIILVNILHRFFLRVIHEEYFSLKDADDELNNFAA